METLRIIALLIAMFVVPSVVVIVAQNCIGDDSEHCYQGSQQC